MLSPWQAVAGNDRYTTLLSRNRKDSFFKGFRHFIVKPKASREGFGGH
jgi:hypothetical protein